MVQQLGVYPVHTAEVWFPEHASDSQLPLSLTPKVSGTLVCGTLWTPEIIYQPPHRQVNNKKVKKKSK